MTENSELMTIEEVAKYLRVSERTVYDWAQEKEIPCGKLGTVWRFRRSEIEQWVNSRLGNASRTPDFSGINLRVVLESARVLQLACTHKVEALDALIGVLATAPGVKDKKALAEGVYYREKLMSTGIGMGIAVPHVRLDSIDHIVMAAASCQNPITDYESLDNQPVRLIFMIAAGKNQHAQHIKVLAAISSRLKQSALQESLLLAPDGAAFVDILAGREG